MGLGSLNSQGLESLYLRVLGLGIPMLDRGSVDPVPPLRPRVTRARASPSRFRALQLKPLLKSESSVPEMCSTETQPGPSGAGKVSTRNRPRDPASRKPSSQDQT